MRRRGRSGGSLPQPPSAPSAPPAPRSPGSTRRRILGAMAELAVTAIGRDRPGIVAALTGALLDLGGNIEDSRMSILRGHFAVTLIVSVADEEDPAAVESRLGQVRDELGLEAVAVNPIDP